MAEGVPLPRQRQQRASSVVLQRDDGVWVRFTPELVGREGRRFSQLRDYPGVGVRGGAKAGAWGRRQRREGHGRTVLGVREAELTATGLQRPLTSVEGQQRARSAPRSARETAGGPQGELPVAGSTSGGSSDDGATLSAGVDYIRRGRTARPTPQPLKVTSLVAVTAAMRPGAWWYCQ